MEQCLLDAEILSNEEMPIQQSHLDKLEQRILARISEVSKELRELASGVDTRITNTVTVQIKQFRETLTGGKKVARWLKEWGAVGAAITGAIALFGIMMAAVYFAASEVGAGREFRGEVRQHLKDIDGDVAGLKARSAAESPTDPRSQLAASQVIATAREKKIVIPQQATEQAGNGFIQGAAWGDQGAWDTALQFVSYRTFLNGTLVSLGKELPLPRGVGYLYMTDPTIEVKERPKPVLRFVTHGAREDEAARFDRIGVDHNKDRPVTPAALIVEGGAIRIDNQDIHNTIFDGVEVHYSGAPIILRKVFFRNCVFVFENNDQERQLGRAILASSADMDFKWPG